MASERTYTVHRVEPTLRIRCLNPFPEGEMWIKPPPQVARYRITVIRPRVRFRLRRPGRTALDQSSPLAVPFHWRHLTPLMVKVLQSAKLGVLREDDTCFDFYRHFRCPDRVHRYLMNHGRGVVAYQGNGIWHVLPPRVSGD